MIADTSRAALLSEPVGNLAERASDDEPCCAPFDPAPFEDTVHAWHDRLFATAIILAVAHVPVGMTAAVTRLFRLAEAAGAIPPAGDQLMLMHDPSPWRTELLVAVTKDVPGAAMERISGTFFTKVFDGPYRDVPKWIEATEATVAERGERAQRYFLRYAYCPKCVRKYGRNFCVVYAQVA